MIKLLRAEEMRELVKDPIVATCRRYTMDYLMSYMKEEALNEKYNVKLNKKFYTYNPDTHEFTQSYYTIDDCDIQILKQLGYRVYENKECYNIHWCKLIKKKINN